MRGIRRAQQLAEENVRRQYANIPENINDIAQVEIQVGTDGFPFLNERIPGSRYTYQQYYDANLPNQREIEAERMRTREDRGKIDPMSVHYRFDV